jgi:ligand-binding sensor domain-containing protein/signal transduction histidine kinase/DNA-binding response OmpR family regulator
MNLFLKELVWPSMVRKFHGVSIATIFFFFCGLPLFAQVEPLRFDNFTLENGLSNNIIHCIFQDSRGWIWVGTSQGLNRFDGYKFTVFKNNPNNPKSLLGSLVRVIFEDKDSNLWIGTENGGLNKFDREKENFTRYFGNDSSSSLFGNSVNSIVQDNLGKLWVGTEKGLIQMEPASGKVLAYYNHDQNTNSLSNNTVRVLHWDKKGVLWIGTPDGLDCFDPVTKKFQHVLLPYNNRVNDDVIKIFEDTDGLFWIGTYNSGVFILNPENKQVKHFDLDPGNERSITVRAINRDAKGVYLIGTRGGLYLYSKEQKTFSKLLHDVRDPGTLCHSSILDIFKDKKGDLWIGTRGGLSYLTKEKQTFRNYSALPNDNKYLNDNEIYAFWIDPKGDIWIGTERGGVNILNRKTGTFRYLLHDGKNPNSLSKNCIKAFLDDKKGNLWIGTFMGGIDILNLKTGVMEHHFHLHNNPASLIDNRIWSLYQDRENNIWVGTFKGLEKYDAASKSFVDFSYISGNQSVYCLIEDNSNNLWIGGEEELVTYNLKTGKIARFKEHSRSFCLDSKGRMWVATLDKGLALYNKNIGTFTFYDENSGLANNQALCVLEDNSGMLWVSTGNGLSKFSPEKGVLRNFDKADGLQNNQFSYGASYKAPSGELLFGGIAGFNIFDPQNVKDNDFIPPVVFTDFRIFNKAVPIGNDKNSILTKSISETKEINLPYDKNVISVEFAALNFSKSNKNKYEYKLEGFDKNWSEAGVQRFVTYTNLNPGKYTLKVKASNNDNKWNNRAVDLSINVLPPFWKTWWFKSVMLLFIFSTLYTLIIFLTNRAKLKHELVFERLRARKLHELDMMKLRFFTNISHEIRTPLTLILGPLNKMLNSDMTRYETKNYINLMHRNALQLLRLINQLLDYRKLESGSLRLEFKRDDLVGYIKDKVHSFISLTSEKEISIKFSTSENELFVWFDQDKLEKILDNLLSNAIKFTGKGGSVWVSVALAKDAGELSDDQGQNKKIVEIVVKDNGMGIADSHMNKIFNRFFQAQDSANNTGTGIGLAFTKELVKLHGGQIFVESTPGMGSKFTVRLPFNVEYTPEKGVSVSDPTGSETEIEQETPSVTKAEDNGLSQNIILVIEDNPDVRYFIRDHFEPDFKVVEASDGKDGWQQAVKLVPDVIISDILMPGLNGKELCKKLKKDERTSHIPLILLTALSSKDNELDGLVAGADDYITKPFDISILKTKVENLLSLRKSLKEKYTGEMVLKPTNITITSPDERFLQKAITVVEKNIADPELDIDKFATEIGVSRMQLYRKLAALTDMTVKEFIRDIRLQRAAQMLVQKKLTVSEIAYAVGFRDLSHFRKCFRQQFGMTASEYIDDQNIASEA